MTPPSPNDVLARWRNIFELDWWPAAPKTFQRFWEKVASCGLLKVLCETPEYEMKWKHALVYQLGQMWHMGSVRGRLQPEALQTGEPSQNVMWSICVLDLIVQGLIGSRTIPRDPKHSEGSLMLLKHFFPDGAIANWTPTVLRDHVDSYLREHRSDTVLMERFTDVLARATTSARRGGVE